jgi:lysozyme
MKDPPMKAIIVVIILCGSLGSAADVVAQSIVRVPSGSQIEDFEGPLGATPSLPPRDLIPYSIGLIQDFEGWVSTAYDDPAGYCTIGYGHLISKKRCAETALGDFSKSLSRESGLSLLQQDTVTARQAIQTLVKRGLTDQQFGALASFVFNVGKAPFSSSTMLKLINAGEYQKAANEFPRWVKARVKSESVVLEGLVDRRNCEATLFLATNSPPPFKRQNCGSLSATPPSGSLIDISVGEQK